MKLSVPFIPDKAYSAFLENSKDCIDSLYFSLFSGPVLDSRVRFRSMDTGVLAGNLEPFRDIKKYCLVNSRFLPPGRYTDDGFLRRTLDGLQILSDGCGIDGIVFTDAYLLNALSRTGQKIISQLEAVPGVNAMIDSAPKAFSFLELINETGFKQPSKLVLDRSLNRELTALEKTAAKIRNRYPAMGIELLANEGCLLHCPFKLTHDAQISLSNARLARENTHAVNQSLGCHRHFLAHPHTFFKSPFIRPEDLGAYAGLADTVKICGRTLGARFLTHTVTAYCGQSFDGNLIELMDASSFLADHYYIDNKALGKDFLNTLANCGKSCNECNLCPDLFLKTAQQQKPILKPYKDLI